VVAACIVRSKYCRLSDAPTKAPPTSRPNRRKAPQKRDPRLEHLRVQLSPSSFVGLRMVIVDVVQFHATYRLVTLYLGSPYCSPLPSIKSGEARSNQQEKVFPLDQLFPNDVSSSGIPIPIPIPILRATKDIRLLLHSLLLLPLVGLQVKAHHRPGHLTRIGNTPKFTTHLGSPRLRSTNFSPPTSSVP